MDTPKSQLPFEILRNVFSHLNKRSDLVQCQLTCRQWYQASTEQLYEAVMVNHETRVTSFIRALKSSPMVGRSVKKINAGSMFYKKGRELVTWDKQDLLTNILEYCPNVLEIEAAIPESTLWVRLMYAAVNDELQFLEALPQPEHDQIENYAYTALAFKRTLNKLVLCDARRFENSTGREINFRAYNILLQKLKDFPNLKELKILHHTNAPLSAFDAVIEDCARLQTLYVAVYPLLEDLGNQTPRNNSSSDNFLHTIRPRQHIKDVSGIWEIMDNDDSINYFMHKFPKLRKMDFRFGSRPALRPTPIYDISAQVLTTFINYVSDIPTVYIECAFRKQGPSFIDVFVDYMKNSKYYGRIGIDYGFRTKPGLQRMCFQKHPTLIDGLNTTFSFEANDSHFTLPHMELMMKAGSMIESLEVSRILDVQTHFGSRREGNEYLYDMANGFWLEDILQKCPSLKDLAIYQPGYINLDKSISPVYPSLERMFITNLFTRESDSVIADLSMRLPSLKHLHLFHYEEERKNIITLNMQCTNFDTLIWDKSSSIHSFDKNDWKFYVKLTTKQHSETYWEGDEHDLKPSSAEFYLKSLMVQGVLSFDIQCMSIKVFWIKFDNFVNKKHTLNL